MRIIELRIQDFKRIKVARWKLDPYLNEIRGQNRQGKSSVLDALFSALGGGRACPSEPIRSGSRSAKTVVDLGDLKITRTFSPSGTFLQVEDRDGDVKRAPQELLNSLGTALGMDPLAFVRADPKQQVAMLLSAFQVSIEDLAAEFKSVTEERTEANRELKRLRGAIEKIVVDPRATVMPIDVDRLKVRRAVLVEQRDAIDAELKRITELFDQSQSQQIQLARLQDRENLEGEAEEVAYTSEILTRRLDEIRDEKRDRLKSVESRIGGLTIDDDEIRFNGNPLDQASSAEQIQLGLQVAMASDPKLRVVLIRDGSLLDDASLAALEEWAAAKDVQVLIERVGESKPTYPGILMIDGEIADRNGDEPEPELFQHTTIDDTTKEAEDLF